MPTHRTQAPHKGWTIVLASLGVFMTALDTLVVTTALPVMRVDLGGSLSDLEWTVNAYNLAFACALLTGAALGASTCSAAIAACTWYGPGVRRRSARSSSVRPSRMRPRSQRERSCSSRRT